MGEIYEVAEYGRRANDATFRQIAERAFARTGGEFGPVHYEDRKSPHGRQYAYAWAERQDSHD